MSENDENYEPDIIGVVDENGEEILFELIDRYETEKDVYVAVTPYYESAEEIVEGDNELIVLKVINENGEEMLTMIEDENELDDVVQIFENRLSDIYEIEPLTPEQ